MRFLLLGVAALALAGCAGPPAAKANPAPAAAPERPAVQPGFLKWTAVAPGFEAADLPVLSGGRVVEHVLLARIDPRRFRFVVLNRADDRYSLDQWMAALHPALVVNGSFFTVQGTPDTPVKSRGVLLGPADYQARAGAFVAGPGFVGIRDLSREDWRAAFAGADEAMVSYPLLIAHGVKGNVRASGRLADRSFVGQDGQGRILIGTTAGGYFSLDALADFLLRAPLGLRMALNLDGGPVACQGISLNGFRRVVYGPLPAGGCPLPIVLLAFPK